MHAETLLTPKPIGCRWVARTLTILLAALALLASRAALAQQGFTLGTNLVDLSQAKGNETDPSIAINPLNPSNMVVVAATDRTNGGLLLAFTTNLGGIWTSNFIATNGNAQGLLPAGGAYAEPSVAFDAYGNLFLAYLPTNFLGVTIGVSTNGGQTFASLTNLASLDVTDQPRITAPPMGAAAGSVWVVYKDYTTANSPLQVQGLISTGLGANGNFGVTEIVPGSGDGGFADIAVGPLGQVMVAFQDNLDGQPNPAFYPLANIFVSVETNAVAGGNLTYEGFGAAQLVASDAIGGVTYIQAAPDGIGINAAPGLSWDFDANDPYYGSVYLVYTAVGPEGNAVIAFNSSTNAGNLAANWNGESYVDDDAINGFEGSFNDHFLPRVAVDPISGIVVCSWYDCRNDQGGNSQVITNVIQNKFTFTNDLSMITNVSLVPPNNLAYYVDTTGQGSNLIVYIEANNVNGTTMTSDTYSNIYIGNTTNTNYTITLSGTNSGTSTVTVILTNLVTTAYTSGNGANQEAVMYETISTNGGGSFEANQQLLSLNLPIGAPARGIASDVAGSDSLTGWGHYTGLAAYGASFFPVWADNSDVTTNNPDGANTNFDIYMLASAKGSDSVSYADLTVFVTTSPAPTNIISQEVITFFVIVTNRGIATAGPVTVTNILSTNLTLLPNSIVPSLFGTYAIGNLPNGQEEIIFTLPVMTNGAVLTNTFRMSASISSIATNLATVYSTTLDLIPTNTSNTLILVIEGEDLAMGMTASETNVLIGDTVISTVTVTNLGPATNGPVFITNYFSSNWTNVTVQAQGTNQVTNSSSGPIAIVNLGLLPVNKPVTATFFATAGSGSTSASESAYVGSQDIDTNHANNSNSLSFFVNDENLGVGMTSSSPTVNQGAPFTYTISVTNFGLSYSGLITVTANLSSNVVPVSATESQGSSVLVVNPTNIYNQVIFSLGTLGAGQIATMTLTGVVAVGPPSSFDITQAPSLTNNVVVTSTDFDTNVVNNTTSDITPINSEDLVLGVTPSSATADQGEPITYTIKVANLGLSSAGLVTVTNTLSTNLSQLSATESQGTNAIIDNQVIFSLGTIGAGQVATMTVTGITAIGPPSTVALSQVPVVSDVASISSTAFDTNLDNNGASSIEAVNAEDLAFGQSESTNAVDLGTPVTFTISVTNLGPSYDGLITVSDILSTNLGQLSAMQSQGTNTIAGNEVLFTLGTMGAGEVATLTVSAIALSGPQAASSIIAVSSTAFQTNLVNNTATNLVTINDEDLAISVTASPASPEVGQTITFSENVTNLGLSANGVALVTNTFSSHLGSIAVLQPSTGYTINGSVVTFNLGALNAGQVVPIIMTAIATSTGAASDTAKVGSLSFDTDTTNNTAKATVTITSPAISNLVVTPLASSAFIVFDTSAGATAQVQYGLTTSYGSVSSLSTTATTHHVILLTGLTGGSNFDYEVQAFIGTTTLTSKGSFTLTNTLILTTPNAFYSGLWTEGSIATGIYGPYYQYSTTTVLNASSEAVFDPAIPAAGLYDLSIWYPANPSFTTNAQVYVNAGTNDFLLSVNQTVNGGAWFQLEPNIYFASGTNGNVILENNTGEANKLLVANAMMWVYNAAQDYPTNGSIPAWWADFYFGAGVKGYVNGATIAANGYSMFANYVLGLNPTDPLASLSFTMTPMSSNEISFTFTPYQGGRSYQLQTATSLDSPAWTTLTNAPTESTNGVGTFSLTSTNSANAFYRLSAYIVP